MLKKCVLICLSVVVLAGCAPVAHVQRTISPDTIVDKHLRDAGESISHDLAVLTGSRQSRDHGAMPGAGDLYTIMSLTWDGPLEGALSRLASHIGFKLQVEGKPPPTPVLIHVKMIDRPALTILRDIGSQTGPKEGIAVLEDTGTIRLIYEERMRS